MFVGFVGLGNMGAAMASRLVGAGHRVRVWNRSVGPMEKLMGQGAEAAGSLPELAEAEIVLSMLANDEAVRETFLRQGLLAALRPGTVHANMATVSVSLAREMAGLHRERGVSYVSSPVLGRPDAAAAGKLNIMAAGSADAIAVVQPLLDVLGKTWRFGENAEQANAAKIATNLTLACAIEAMCEAAQLAGSFGVSPVALLGMLTETAFASPAYKLYAPLIAREPTSPAGFSAALGLKDVNLALAAGEAARVPLPFASVLRDAFLESVAHGEADLEWASALARASRRRSGASGSPAGVLTPPEP
jgi:3-hydroxyisobutyrate dehydrogenase-like beta-hydroxyacid dehydrogenase